MSSSPQPEFKPFVADEENIPELTWFPIIMGALLGIVFGASSMYLVLKVGLTVSASIPVAVLSITLFRVISNVTGLRRTTILENNVVQTTGSAGESLAFGVGLIMPALLLLGFDIDVIRVMTVSVFGGLLGILLMIPLRKAFIVQQHGKLTFPDGKACAEVLVAGEKGGATASMVFSGFGLAFVYQVCMQALHLWKEVAASALSWTGAAGKTVGLKGATLSMELSPSLLGVGYIIGPKIASIMVAGGVLAYLVISPMIVFFGGELTVPLEPGTKLISAMKDGEIRNSYILYIGAGAVAAGGIFSMIKALPIIFGAIITSFRDLFASRDKSAGATRRTDRDLPLPMILAGSILLVIGLMAVPQLGLGFDTKGIAGAMMIVIFGFLFVTVASRLTGEIGSSSNPISGMTVATLLLTCLILLGMEGLGWIAIDKTIKLTALTIAGVVCIASSNGGSTAQALKTGHLVGATPASQQIAILVGAFTSALVVGLVLLAMNEANSTYSKKAIEPYKDVVVDVAGLPKDTVHSGDYATEDKNEYFVLNLGRAETGGALPPGRYLIGTDGKPVYLVDPAINGMLKEDDQGNDLSGNKFDAPKTVLMQLIIDGILDRRLPWGLVLFGVLIAVTLELSGVPSLPFAVGVYLPLAASTPIFAGGVIRWFVDRWHRKAADGEDDSSPAVLLSSGYIAGGAIAAVLISFMNFRPALLNAFDFAAPVPIDGAKSDSLVAGLIPKEILENTWVALGAFGVLALVMLIIGLASRPKSSAS
ncbi:MAG: OPT family oligopeptide transporter [Planctomycetota bacterium]